MRHILMSTLEQIPSWPIGITARAALVLAAAGLLTLLMRRSFAAARHLVWTAAAAATLALPALSLLPGWHILPVVHAAPPRPAPPAFTMTPAPTTAPEPPSAAAFPPPTFNLPPVRPAPAPASPSVLPAPARIDVPTLVLLAWAAGALAFMVPPVLGRILLARMARRCQPADESWTPAITQACADAGLRRPVRLLLGPNRAMPMAWGMGRGATVLLPAAAAGWPAARRRTVLLHELAHVRRADCLTDLLAQAARALHWFNPLAHIALWRLRVERERACDDAVLRLGARAPEYAADLLDITARLRPSRLGAAAMAIARSSKLEGRIREILDTRRNRRALRPRHTLAAAIAAALLAIPVAAMRPASPPPPSAAGPSVFPSGVPTDGQGGNTEQVDADALERSIDKLFRISHAIGKYAAENQGRFPPDLGATLAYCGLKGTPAEQARIYISPHDERKVDIPESPTPEWVNANTSYIYLGQGLEWAIVPDGIAYFVLVHERLDGTYPNPKAGDEPVIPYMMLQGGVIAEPRARVEAQIAEANYIYGPAKSGLPFPPHLQAVWDLRVVSKAVLAYAEDHGGELPPDLGSTLRYIPADSNRTATPAQRAAAYLSPRAKATTRVPEEPTPEWVNSHATYVYLGGAGTNIVKIPDRMCTLLLHGPLDEELQTNWPGQNAWVIPWGDAQSGAGVTSKDYAAALIGESRAVLAAARTGQGMPDYYAAMRDIRAICAGINAFAKDHDDLLPPDLGSVLPYISTETLPSATPAERARVFVSPEAERTIAVPEDPKPEWVNSHATYTYLGDGGVRLTEARKAGVTIMVHGDLQRRYDIAYHGGSIRLLPMGGPGGMILGFPDASVEGYLDPSKEAIAKLRAAR